MIQNYDDRRITGFTIVELMIAMAFISLLLLAIAAAILQIGAIYNKGITMKSVNQSGRQIVTDMKRTIGESPPSAIVFKPHDYNQGSQDVADYDGGRLCTGLYSYIWNIGKHIDPSVPASQINKYAGDDSEKQLRLVRVRDSSKQYCEGTATNPIQSDNATEMLSESNLAVQDFQIERITNNMASGMALYDIRITISNADREAINTVDNNCKPPSEDRTLQGYCAVNEFAFTARAGNKGGQ